jgi:Alkylmercury lyase
MAAPDSEIRAAAFRLLLQTGRSVTAAQIAAEIDAQPNTVEADLHRLGGAGRIRQNEAGQVIGSAGLSVALAAHELWLGPRRFWTWCAYDVVGIVAALEADARSISPSPASGATIQLQFVGGHPPASPVALFFPDDRGSIRTVNDWCVNANFFENREAAQSWSTQRKIPGEVIDLAEARRRGLENWRPLLINTRDH